MIKITSFSRSEVFIDFLCRNFKDYTFKWFPVEEPFLKFNFYFENRTNAILVIIKENQVFVGSVPDLTGLAVFEWLLKKREIVYENV